MVADKLIDVVNGKVALNPAVIIENNRITEILSSIENLDQSAEVIRLDGMTLAPGMIDMHTHLTADAREHGYSGIVTSTIRSTLKGVTHARQTLEAGVACITPLGVTEFHRNGILYFHAASRSLIEVFPLCKGIVHEAEEGGYRAEVPSILGCATQGDTFDERGIMGSSLEL